MGNMFAVGSPSNYLIGANDEHGINPAAKGKKTPLIPYINRQIYDNEFNKEAKKFFIAACLRTGYRVLDVKPDLEDISIAQRRQIIEKGNPDILVTFGCNSYLNKFNTTNGNEVFYSNLNKQAGSSRLLAEYIYYQIITGTNQNGRGVGILDVMVTATATMPAALVEAGFLTNLKDTKLMLDPDYQKAVGEYCCAGVSNYLGIPFTPQVTPLVRPALKRGMSGDNVKYLQQKLYAKLYDISVEDGDFGQNTETAVKAFQREHNLTADGIVSTKTWAKIIPLGNGRT